MRDRDKDTLYLLRRRLHYTRRFRREFGWGWRYCWQTAGRNQRVALQAMYELRVEKVAAFIFERDVQRTLDSLPVTEVHA